MSYTKQNFVDGQVLHAAHLDHIEEGIIDLENIVNDIDLESAVHNALAQAKISGEFDGKDGEDGVSPTVAVSAITGGHKITITDAAGSKSVDVMDGSDGKQGAPGEPGRGIVSITRTAGTGAAGTVDTYTISFTDNTTSTFTVYNGANGKDGTGGTGSGGTGADGEDGATFTPYVDANGNLSWSNDKGLANPATVNIKGPQGDTGAVGEDGVSATHSWSGTILTITSASGTSSADLKGDKGDTGPQGPQGDKGDKGDTPVKGVNYYTQDDKIEMVNAVLSALPTWTGGSY